MATVFDVFKEVSYKYLTVSRGTVYGNSITNVSSPRQGVFKLRRGIILDDMENLDSAATLHVHPEDYSPPYAPLVGDGIMVNGDYYQILEITEGMNYQTGITEHLTLKLGVADYADNS